MGLSIQDRELDMLARELAGLTGETLSQAIGRAIEERLARLRRESLYEKRVAKIDALTTQLRENLTGVILEDDDLYGVDGLPRCDN